MEVAVHAGIRLLQRLRAAQDENPLRLEVVRRRRGLCGLQDQLQLLVLHGAVAVFAQRIALRGQSLKIHRISPFPRAAVSPASFVVAPL